MNAEKRRQIGLFANTVRSALKLSTPVTYDHLKSAVVRMGGELKELPFVAREASICRIDDTHFEIILDLTMPAKRQVFSLSHEIAHLFLHMGYGTNTWQKAQTYKESYARSGYSEEELEANEFAGALLMPREEFTSLKQRGIKVTQIAEHFGVSEDAALTRGKWLGLFAW